MATNVCQFASLIDNSYTKIDYYEDKKKKMAAMSVSWF